MATVSVRAAGPGLQRLERYPIPIATFRRLPPGRRRLRGKRDLSMPDAPKPSYVGQLQAASRRADQGLETEEIAAAMQTGRPGQDDKWLFSALVLTIGSLGPNLLAAANFDQILSMTGWQRLALLLGMDILFSITSSGFLRVSEDFFVQRHGSFPKYPGPWTTVPLKLQGSYEKPARNPPKYFRKYVQVLPLGTGVIMPLGLLLYALFKTPDGPLAAAVILPYLLTIFVQIRQEATVVRTGSPIWPMIPVVHMLYRFLQTARGTWLVAALDGPQWQIWLMAYLTCLWCFNFACVMAWMAPMYYWHRQPAGSEDGS